MTTSPPPTSPSLVWFREDLRLADHPALHAAIARTAPVICVYILEDGAGLRALGGASRWWLHESLGALCADLDKRGGRLDLFQGKPDLIIPALVKASGAGALFWNRRYGGAERAIDEKIEKALAKSDCHVETFNGRLLHEPWEIRTKGGGPYSVYTPYWKAAVALGYDLHPLPKPRKVQTADYPARGPHRTSLVKLNLLPTKPDWAGGLRRRWAPGEAGATKRLKTFLDGDVASYERDRNQLAVEGTSYLSPHLRFGEISPRQIAASGHASADKAPATQQGMKKFLAELGWREFDYQVLFRHPDVATANLHAQFDKMPWRRLSEAELHAWQTGHTGFPIVDAGMRELWATGYMHNRVRMVTASLLIKHLLCDWRIGEQWFWDCLCDADPANNTMNWQWVAGSGFDAAPFFRVFNPVLQGKRFDPEGDYVRAHVPELSKLPNRVIHEPWRAKADVLAKAGVELGATYPKPMVDHNIARERALAAFRKLKAAPKQRKTKD